MKRRTGAGILCSTKRGSERESMTRKATGSITQPIMLEFPRDVDVVVTVSSTGIATPGIEARVGLEMGFRPTVMRAPVFGRGCAGGVSGLTLGARLARSEPGEVVLVVVVELCTLVRSAKSCGASAIPMTAPNNAVRCRH